MPGSENAFGVEIWVIRKINQYLNDQDWRSVQCHVWSCAHPNFDFWSRAYRRGWKRKLEHVQPRRCSSRILVRSRSELLDRVHRVEYCWALPLRGRGVPRVLHLLLQEKDCAQADWVDQHFQAGLRDSNRRRMACIHPRRAQKLTVLGEQAGV